MIHFLQANNVGIMSGYFLWKKKDFFWLISKHSELFSRYFSAIQIQHLSRNRLSYFNFCRPDVQAYNETLSFYILFKKHDSRAVENSKLLIMPLMAIC